MSSKRIILGVVLLALIALALLVRQPIQSWAATQSCVNSGRDHYANVETLANAPDFESYMAQIRRQCRARAAQNRFEAAETEAGRREAGEEAIDAYSALIAAEGSWNWTYLPQRGAIYAELGELEKGLADYTLFLAHAPDSYWALEARADLYAANGRYEEALVDLEAAYRQAQAEEPVSEGTLARIEQRMAEVKAQQ